MFAELFCKVFPSLCWKEGKDLGVFSRVCMWMFPTICMCEKKDLEETRVRLEKEDREILEKQNARAEKKRAQAAKDVAAKEAAAKLVEAQLAQEQADIQKRGKFELISKKIKGSTAALAPLALNEDVLKAMGKHKAVILQTRTEMIATYKHQLGFKEHRYENWIAPSTYCVAEKVWEQKSWGRQLKRARRNNNALYKSASKVEDILQFDTPGHLLLDEVICITSFKDRCSENLAKSAKLQWGGYYFINWKPDCDCGKKDSACFRIVRMSSLAVHVNFNFVWLGATDPSLKKKKSGEVVTTPTGSKGVAPPSAPTIVATEPVKVRLPNNSQTSDHGPELRVNFTGRVPPLLVPKPESVSFASILEEQMATVVSQTTDTKQPAVLEVD